MRTLIVTWENFQDQEVVYPYYRALEEAERRDDVIICANVVGKFFGIMGSNMTSHALISDLCSKDGLANTVNGFDLLVLPGGVKALEKLRQENSVRELIREWNSRGKIIASTCHGAQLLISARVVEGRNISGYYSLEDDINNAGATYVNRPVVIDKNIVSSPHYDFMGEWMASAISLVRGN